MTVAFICSLDLDPAELSSLDDLTIEIQTALEMIGLEVSYVRPWAGDNREIPVEKPFKPVMPMTPQDATVPTLLP